jgi:hypothetical protein
MKLIPYTVKYQFSVRRLRGAPYLTSTALVLIPDKAKFSESLINNKIIVINFKPYVQGSFPRQETRNEK